MAALAVWTDSGIMNEERPSENRNGSLYNRFFRRPANHAEGRLKGGKRWQIDSTCHGVAVLQPEENDFAGCHGGNRIGYVLLYRLRFAALYRK
ncbi:hypothetical protein [Neisseria animaloris]|uniref:hypothetical protein n=1 Tax=Neisseria animaloris TaxID=326522 RepID=UPI0039E1B44F